MFRKENFKIIILSFLLLIILIPFLDTPPMLDSTKYIEFSIALRSGNFFDEEAIISMGSYLAPYRDTHPPFMILIMSMFDPIKDVIPFYIFSILLYLISFIIACKAFKKPFLIFLIYFSPALIVMINSFMLDQFTFIFISMALSFYKFFNDSPKMLHAVLMSCFLSFAIFTSYSAGLICVFLLIDTLIKAKKINIPALIPVILILFYIFIIQMITGNNILLDALSWQSSGALYENIPVLEKIIYVIVSFGFINLAITLSLIRRKTIFYLLILIFFISGFLQLNSYTIYAIVLSALSFLYLIFKLGKRERIYILTTIVLLIIIFPNPAMRNILFVLPFVYIGLKNVKVKIPDLILGIMLAVFTLIANNDYCKTMYELSENTIVQEINSKFSSNSMLRYIIRKRQFKDFCHETMDFEDVYKGTLYSKLQKGNTLISEMTVDRFFPFNNEIGFTKMFTKRTKTSFDIYDNGSMFYCVFPFIPLNFKVSNAVLFKYDIGKKKNYSTKAPEEEEKIDYKYFVFEGYSISVNDSIRYDVFLKYKKYREIIVFLHSGEGDDLIQSYKHIVVKDLDNEGRAIVSLDIPKDEREHKVIFTDKKLRPFRAKNGERYFILNDGLKKTAD